MNLDEDSSLPDPFKGIQIKNPHFPSRGELGPKSMHVESLRKSMINDVGLEWTLFLIFHTRFPPHDKDGKFVAQTQKKERRRIKNLIMNAFNFPQQRNFLISPLFFSPSSPPPPMV